MTLSWTISSSLRSLISRLVETLTTFIQRGGIRIILYSILGISIIIFIALMPFWGLPNRQSRGEPSRQPSVERETAGQEQGQDLEQSSVRSAKRRKPSPLVLSQDARALQNHTSRTSRSVQSPRSATRTYTSGPLNSPPLHTVLEGTCLSDSPTLERGAAARIEPGFVQGRLPQEILVIVFQYVSLQHEISLGHFRLSTLLSLRRVCKNWKGIVDNTPKLWPSLHPPLSTMGCELCVDWYMGVTGELSKLVKGLDFVVLELPGEGQEIHRSLLSHQLNLAISSFAMKVIIPRRLSGGTDGLPSSLLVGTPTLRRLSDGPAMENLRKLEWIMEGRYFVDQLPQSVGLPWTSLRQLPWVQLTHITLAMLMTLQNCEFIIDSAPAVEYLVLRDVSGEPLPATNDWIERITRSRLHTLKISSAVSISSLLRKYDLQQLRNVEFELGMDSAMDLPQIPWRELTHVSLSCAFTDDLMKSVITQLHDVEVLVLKGQLPDDNAGWTVSCTLESLKSFTLVPIADAAAPRLMSHFIERIFPASIETIDAPMTVDTFKQIIGHPFSSLKTINLKNHPVSPDDFLRFLARSKNLVEGSFKIHDYYNPPFPSLPSGVLSPIPSPTIPSFPPPPDKIICNIAKLELHLDYQCSEANTLLDALDLPKLSSLKLSASRRSSACESLHELLARSGCALSSFSLDCPAAINTRALEFLGLVGSTLESFEIKSDHESEFGRTLWTALMHGRTGASRTKCFCPRLEHLVVVPCRDPDSFYRMVASRSNFPSECECGLRKLRHVEAVLDDTPERCYEFAQHLKAKNILCKLEPNSHPNVGF